MLKMQKFRDLDIGQKFTYDAPYIDDIWPVIMKIKPFHEIVGMGGPCNTVNAIMHSDGSYLYIEDNQDVIQLKL